MTYKVLIVRNRYKKKLKLSKGLDWFKKRTPIEIVTEELVTDFDVTTEHISNQSYAGVICGDDIYPKLRTVIPEGKYHAVVFVYGNQLDGIRVNVAKALPLYPGTDLIQLCTVSDSGKSLNHEIFHTFIHRLQRQQVMIEDPMDRVVVDGIWQNYYNNSNLDAKPSNRSIAIERITPYWDKITTIINPNMPKVTIKRNTDDGVQSLGTLSTDNFTCFTLERPWKNNASNISCIPKGTYECRYTWSLKFLKYTYEIMNVPGRTGIRIHSANFYSELLGCISLGSGYSDINGDSKKDIINSRATILKFEELLMRQPFTILII
jgi:hypothetical protein